jgi:hypothetical protein
VAVTVAGWTNGDAPPLPSSASTAQPGVQKCWIWFGAVVVVAPPTIEGVSL